MGTLDKQRQGGWIVTSKRSGRSHAPRQYLVAADTRKEALALVTGLLGAECAPLVVGGADLIHFTRRGMKRGDICEIGGKGKLALVRRAWAAPENTAES